MATDFQKEMVKVLLYEPDKIKRFIASTGDKNKSYVIGFLYRLLNYRIGIEIDCAGGDIHIPAKYQHLFYSSTPGKRNPVGIDYDGHMSNGYQKALDGDFSEGIELKLSFFKITALKHLKSVLDDLSKSSTILPASNGGLHIHVDLGNRLKALHAADRTTTYYIKRRLLNLKPFISKVFGVKPAREGSEFVAFGYTAGVSVFRHHNTAEYRLGVPTFNYTTIMRYVLVCTLINYSIRLRRRFDFDLAQAILQS